MSDRLDLGPGRVLYVKENTSRARDRARRLVLLPAAALMVLLVGCRADDSNPRAQSTPGVTTFEQGRFDDLPQFPRSQPLSARAEERGVIARSYKATGASPQQVMEFYRDALGQRWTMVTGIEKLGVGTFRADWVGEDYRLRVSATAEPELDSRNDASQTVVTQYSLTLNPL